MNISVSPSLSTAQVLIVDASAEERHLLSEMLRGQDFHLNVASGGREAYELAQQVSPDLILMNLQTLGSEATSIERQLRQNPLTERVSLLFYATAKYMSENSLLESSDMLDYLIKPFTVGQLLDRVRARLHLSSMLKEGKRSDSEALLTSGRDDLELLRHAKAYMEMHLAEIRRLADIAKALSVSERRLAQAFHSGTNMSAAEYLRRERMHKAKYLLTHTTQSIRDIAQQVGFSSAANFSTAFNSWVGASPSSFRSQALTSSLSIDRRLNH